MDNTMIQVCAAGILAVMILKEVFNFLKDRDKNSKGKSDTVKIQCSSEDVVKSVRSEQRDIKQKVDQMHSLVGGNNAFDDEGRPKIHRIPGDHTAIQEIHATSKKQTDILEMIATTQKSQADNAVKQTQLIKDILREVEHE